MENKSSILPDAVANRHVVIIGAGYGGVATAKQLEAFGFDVTLIDKKGFFYHAVGSVRIPAVKDWINNVAFPLDQLLKRPKSKVIVGSVKHIDTTKKTVEVDTSTNTVISYDYLVIATGASRPTAYPTRVPDNVKSIETITKLTAELFEATKAAKNIVIVGGGPVGVEMAAEIRHAYPDKAITIVSSGPRLFNNSTPALLEATTDAILQKITSQKIDVILNEYVMSPKDSEGHGIVSPSDNKVVTSSGKTVAADLVFFATGNGSGAASSLPYPSSWLNEHKQVQVNPELQVKGASSGSTNGGVVFAVGDVTDTAETKFAYYAKNHAAVVSANIYALASASASSSEPTLKAYEPPSQAIAFVTLGPADGAVEMGGAYKGWIGKQMAKAFKGKDFMAGGTRADLNLK